MSTLRPPPGSGQPKTLKGGRKDMNVVKRARFPNQSGSEESKMKILELQKQIEMKEAELLRMKETLARNDTTDMTAAQIELNRLQAAFEKASKMADSKLDPVTQKLQETQAEYESKKFRMKMFHQAAKERDNSLKLMQKRIDAITAELDSPEQYPVDESQLRTLLNESQRLQHEIECTHRVRQLNSFKGKAFQQINDVLTKAFDEQKKKEAASTKKNESVRQATEVKASRQKVVIDDDWVIARHTMDKLRIMLEDAKRSIRFLTETAEQLSNSNKRVTDDIAVASDELRVLAKYLPGAKHTEQKKTDGVSRTDLTSMEIRKECDEVKLSTDRMKTQAVKSSLETLRTKMVEMPPVVKTHQQNVDQARIERENAENALRQAHELRAELLSRKQFAEQEEELLIQRIEQQKAELARIHEATENARTELQKQKTVMLLNEEMQHLKTMNFDKFTSTIANLMSIKRTMA